MASTAGEYTFRAHPKGDTNSKVLALALAPRSISRSMRTSVRRPVAAKGEYTAKYELKGGQICLDCEESDDDWRAQISMAT
jgi:hypothetical protein